MTSHASLFVKISTENGRVVNGRSRERALGAVEFQRGTQFLKSNRITLAYGLTSNKYQTFIDVNCSLSSYFEEYFDFVLFLGALGGMTAFDPFGSAFEGHGSPPPVDR